MYVIIKWDKSIRMTDALSAAIERAADFLEAQYMKTINSVIASYYNRLTRIVKDTISSGDAVSMRRAHKALLKNAAADAYRDGYKEGGINPAELDAEDRDAYDEAIADWIAGQLEYVNQFAADAKAAHKDKSLRQDVLDRVETWGTSLRNFGEAGKVAALGNIYLTFNGDDGEESCDDCQRYKGQRHRRNWWADRGLLERNGNPNYECERWDNCHHSFYDDKGKVIVS